MYSLSEAGGGGCPRIFEEAARLNYKGREVGLGEGEDDDIVVVKKTEGGGGRGEVEKVIIELLE